MTALAACTSAADEPRAGPSVTWKAKTATQATEHTWYGSTTIALTPDADAEQIVRALESQFREDERFDVRNRRDVVDEYEIQLMSPETRRACTSTALVQPRDDAVTRFFSRM